MDKWILRDAERYASAHRRKRRWYQVMTCLAAVVVFCTTYALILPAITLEKQCQIPEHTHTDSCYTQVTSREKSVLACEVEADAVIHKHDAACRDENGNLVCSLPELEAHRHTDSCYTIPEVHAHTDACYTWERGELTCTQSTEPQHIHTEDCYQESSDLVCGTSESTGHTHGEDCCDDDGNLICGQEVSQGHTHGEGCHQVSRQLICGQTEEPAHQHTDECYSWNQVLTCGQSTEAAQPVLTCKKDEIELHTHQPFVSEEDRGCYDAEGKNLVCGKPQVVEHQHTGACFKTVTEVVDTETLTCTLPKDENHTHGPLCYGTWILTCGLEEHTHSEACAPAEAEDTVFCGKEAHTHEAECWDENGNLVCTLEEHTHSLACYSDPTADVETQNDWQQSFGDVTLTGNWRQDAVAIAKTQLGYTESTANYLVEDDGKTLRGYTRYGAWYGDPYGDWDAMFVSFCLHYAGAEDIPMDKDCGSWVTALADAFIPAQSHEAAPGELVFFDRDGDGTADHVALVSEVTAGEDGIPSGFTAIAGDVDNAVQQLSYAAEDSTILGYGILPEQAKEFTLTAQTETGITVTISGDSASLPCLVSEVTVTAAEVAEEESKAVRDQLMEEENVEPEKRFLLDITLWQGEEEIEPVGPVTVTFSGFDTEGLYPKVYHIDTEAKEVTDMGAMKDEAGDITVSTDHFSYYDVRLRSAPEGTGISGENITKIAGGGTYYLTGTAFTSNTITITGNTTLDLNGYDVYYKGTDNFLVVNSGGTLTIKDSNPASVSESNGSGNLYGNVASLESNGNKPVKLTYYVTESSANGTGTSETLKKYEVTPTGCIVGEADGGAASIVKVNSGGTCNLEGGLLTIKNSSSYNGDAHIIYNNSGTLNLSGGYVAGGKDSCWGGGIFSENGTVNMSGGVIADNYGTNGGGLCVKGGSFTMSGGVISGNGTHSANVTTGNWDKGLGGGIFAQNATVRIEGGYITNNSEYGKCGQDGFGCHGGGGIATTGGSLTMTGGYVTGNYSQEAGGGMYVGHFNLGGTNFSMSGGIVAGNVAQQSEGGGIRIGGGTNGVINASGGKVYITNNRTNTTFDWGGGGIFVQADGNLTVINGLITNNSAGGYGGGVAACPTGKTLIVHAEGAAIYGNSDLGQNMSGGGNDKKADTNVAKANSTFTSNGHKDYFCVRDSGNDPISLVTGEMPGGGAANWTGSSDGTPITISKTGYATANYLFGLAANPDSDAISAAKNAARVIITGNHSNIHGGGIMTNGGLIIGNPEEGVVTATSALDISGTKSLLKDGVSQSDGRDFQFQLKDSSGAVVGTATANASTGEFTISPNTKYSQAGTYTYTLNEVNDSRTGVTYDASEYTIQVTIAKKEVTLLGVKFTSYYVNSVNINKSGGADTTEPTQPDPQPDTHPNTFRVHFKKPGDWPGVKLYIWDGKGVPNSNGWPGDPVDENPAHPGWYTEEFTVSGDGSFHCKFNYGDSYQKEFYINFSAGGDLWAYADGSKFTAAPDDWNGGSSGSSGGSNVSFTGTKNSDGSYSLTINGSAFTNTQVTLLNIQLVKKDSNDSNKLLQGAVFLLKQAGQTEETTITTDNDGIALFTGISRNGTYYLYEQTPPENYMPAGPWIIEVVNSTATMYPATVGEDGTLTKASTTGTPLTVGENNTLTVEIPNQPWGYELPDTGGAGTQPYTMGGIALMAAAVMFLLYSHTRRRKEDAPSS